MKPTKQRKQEVLKNLLMKESWELEAIKGDNARAQKILQRETRVLQQANEALQATFLELREFLEIDAPLQLDTLRTMTLYHAEKNREQVDQQSRQQQAETEANTIARQLTRKMHYSQGLEEIEKSTCKDIHVAHEKVTLREIEDLWAQQYRRRR